MPKIFNFKNVEKQGGGIYKGGGGIYSEWLWSENVENVSEMSFGPLPQDRFNIAKIFLGLPPKPRLSSDTIIYVKS